MSIQALGYLGVRAPDIHDWATCGTNLLGLQRVDKTQSTLAFRMDDRKQRLFVDGTGGSGIAFFGWEVENGRALEDVAARLEKAGVAVARGSRALADERHVRDLIVFHDPIGHRLEAFHGPEVASEPFVPGRNISGFRTGAHGMGHVVLHVENLADVLPFYTDVLGFRVSDYITRPFPAYFLHVNSRHHSLALIQFGKNGVHHLMMELFSLDDVGQGYDLAQLEEDRVAVSLGRHAGDYMTSFYVFNPSGFMVEYGWGGQDINPSTWQPFERTTGPSLWGHERKWLPPEKQLEAREMRIKAAAEGVRRPVQVMEGNYQLMPGTCPWWDSAKMARQA